MFIYLFFFDIAYADQEFLDKVAEHMFVHRRCARDHKSLPSANVPYLAVLRALEDNLKTAKFVYRIKDIVGCTSGQFGFTPFRFCHTKSLTNCVLQG